MALHQVGAPALDCIMWVGPLRLRKQPHILRPHMQCLCRNQNIPCIVMPLWGPRSL